jgi:hypothetical protein
MVDIPLSVLLKVTPPSQPPPPFTSTTQLNSELSKQLIPGEYILSSTAPDFLKNSLSQSKANAIYNHLWFAGTPGKYRTLHEQAVFCRKIIITEEPHLHLVWYKEAIYIKPLPPCLTNFAFFQEFCCGERIYGETCGLLYSYTQLIRYESDFRIAREMGLLRSDGITWQQWQSFRLEVKSNLDGKWNILDQRYRYGELRLSRLNFVYALKCREIKGYHNVYTRYAPYFSRYFTGAILIFAFASITLTAMQVAIQDPAPSISPVFARTTFRFSITILCAVAGIVCMMVALFIPIVMFDLGSGLVVNKRLARDMRNANP